jgi:hypothetical protein
MAVAAVLVVTVMDADAHTHRADVSADDVGGCGRRAKQGHGENGGD